MEAVLIPSRRFGDTRRVLLLAGDTTPRNTLGDIDAFPVPAPAPPTMRTSIHVLYRFSSRQCRAHRRTHAATHDEETSLIPTELGPAAKYANGRISSGMHPGTLPGTLAASGAEAGSTSLYLLR